MVNLLKRKSSDDIVREIHNEVDSAQERLLRQADAFIASLNISVESDIEEKGRRLKQLGFINSNVVKEAEKIIKVKQQQEIEVVKTKEQAELLRYYSQKYPFQKFLTLEELDRICVKYSLIHAPVASYLKEVPEKNLLDLERLQSLDKCDVEPMIYKFHVKDMTTINKLGWENGVSMDEIIHTFIQNEPRYSKERCMKHEWFYPELTDMPLFCIDKEIHGSADYKRYHAKIEIIDKSGFFIAAPKSHFDLENLTKKSKFGFFNVTVIEPKDPIVFEYCKGDIVRVDTKWGIEAEDKLLINEKLN